MEPDFLHNISDLIREIISNVPTDIGTIIGIIGTIIGIIALIIGIAALRLTIVIPYRNNIKELKETFLFIDKKYIEKQRKTKKNKEKQGGNNSGIRGMALVASGNFIERNIEEYILTALKKERKEPIELFIITGKAGSGKTTTLLSIAEKLANSGETVYKYIKGTAENFNKIPNLPLPKRNHKPYIIIDNIHKINGVVDRIEGLSEEDIECVILGTSSEIYKNFIFNDKPIKLEKIRLEKPSENELNRLREKYQVTDKHWELVVNKKPDSIRSFIKWIQEKKNTSLSEIGEISEKRAKKLEDNATAFHAYFIICAFGCIGVSTPHSILRQFVKINNKLESDLSGFVVCVPASDNEFKETIWDPVHKLDAQELLNSSYRNEILKIYDDFIGKLVGTNPNHRLFVAKFCLSALRQSELPDIKDKIINILLGKRKIKDKFIKFIEMNESHKINWANVLTALKEKKIEEKIALKEDKNIIENEKNVIGIDNLIDSIRKQIKPLLSDANIVSESDAIDYLYCCQDKQIKLNPVPKIHTWIKLQDTKLSVVIRSKYLKYIERQGNERELEQVLDYLKTCSKENRKLRKRYLYFARLVKNPEKQKDALNKAKEWIKEENFNDADVNLRYFYLSMMLATTSQEKQKILEDVATELKKNRGNAELQAFYLSLIHWGNKDQKENALSEIKKQLRDIRISFSNKEKIWKRYLYTGYTCAILSMKKEMLKGAEEWLRNHPKSYRVWAGYLYLVSWGTSEQKTKAMNDAKDIIEDTKKKRVNNYTHINYIRINSEYLSLISSWGEEEKRAIAFANTASWFKKNIRYFLYNSSYLRASFFALLRKVIYDSKLNADIRKTPFILSPPQIKKILTIINKSHKTNPLNLRIREEYLFFVALLGNDEQKKKVHEKISVWKNENAMSVNFWVAYLYLVKESNDGKPDEILRLANDWQEDNLTNSEFWVAYMSLIPQAKFDEEALLAVTKWHDDNLNNVGTKFKKMYDALIQKIQAP